MFFGFLGGRGSSGVYNIRIFVSVFFRILEFRVCGCFSFRGRTLVFFVGFVWG